MTSKANNKAIKESENKRRLRPEHWIEAHGLHGDKHWAYPRKVTHCEEDARPGYETKKAHEYMEEENVLKQKVKKLAELIRKAKRVTAYTGAGISTSSGINDYASKGDSKALKRPKIKSMAHALPTLAHRVLGALYWEGYLHHWVQQNHDGLPQKAGVPQHAINEIHGGWFDPSNPVVKMSGDLRDDLFEWMLDEEDKTDLCLALGTSLCGMNADRMAVTPAKKSFKKKALGTVIVALQQTQYDRVAGLRFFCTIDRVFELLAKEMNLKYDMSEPLPYKFLTDPVHWGKQCAKSGIMPIQGECFKAKNEKYYICKNEYDLLDQKEQENFRQIKHKLKKSEVDIFSVPYDKKGNLLSPEERMDIAKWTTLNLRPDAKLMINNGSFKGDKCAIIGKMKHGNHWRICIQHDPNKKYPHGQKGYKSTNRRLGTWMIDSAQQGKLPVLPLINC
mmetsp:Transcript_17731/g.26558  ORF Transcript_17731/g.26558 Transcript_17731/m.26558 type:complete len:448 (+) Transcript_17731:62-1405(+)